MKFYSRFLTMIVVKTVLVVFLMTGISVVGVFAQTNLITNGGFEIDVNPADGIPDDWNLVPYWQNVGSSVQVESSNTFVVNSDDYMMVKGTFNIQNVAGKTFIFSFDVKSPDGSSSGDCLMIKLDDDSYIYPKVTPWNNPANTAWTRVSGAYTCPANAVEIVGTILYRANQTGTISYDNVFITEDGGWNPLGLWNFDDSGSSVALDMSGHGFHGTFNNGAQRVADSSGYCLQLDGLDDYVTFHIQRDEPITEGTFEVWAKPNLTGYWESLQWGTVKQGDVLRSDNIIIVMQDTFWLAVVWDGINVSTIIGPTVIDNTWTHLAITWSGFTARFYVNGQEYEGKLGPMKYASFLLVNYTGKTDVDFYAGMNQPMSAFNGLIDDLILYQRTLSAAEILEHAQSR